MKAFSKRFFQKNGESVNISNPVVRIAAQFASQDVSVVSALPVIVLNRVSTGVQSEGIDDLTGVAYNVYVNPANALIKPKMDVHRQTGQVLHIVSIIEKDKLQILACVDLKDAHGIQ